MQRFKVIKTSRIYTLRLQLEDIKDDKETKHFDLSEGDLVSILYIDKLSEIGEGKEYVINGRVNAILMRDNPLCEICKRYESHYQIVVDASTDYKSRLVEIDPHNILDIHTYPHEYDLLENPVLIPDPLKEGFFVRDIHDNTVHDISVPNDPLLGEKPPEKGGTVNE